MVSSNSELPPSMMMSPGSRSGMRCSMNSSTGGRALTSIMTRRGRLRALTISSSECAPMTFAPLASLPRNSSTLETVRLKATTLKPWSFMLRMRFWPMTAKPMRAISAVGCMLLLSQNRKKTIQWREPCARLFLEDETPLVGPHLTFEPEKEHDQVNDEEQHNHAFQQ